MCAWRTSLSPVIPSIEVLNLIFYGYVWKLTSRRLSFIWGRKSIVSKEAVETQKQNNTKLVLTVFLASHCFIIGSVCLPLFCLKVTSSLSRQLWAFCLSEPLLVLTAQSKSQANRKPGFTVSCKAVWLRLGCWHSFHAQCHVTTSLQLGRAPWKTLISLCDQELPLYLIVLFATWTTAGRLQDLQKPPFTT